MPSPLGHSLAGYAFARFTRVRITRDERAFFAFAAICGILPDMIGQLLEHFTGLESHGFAHSCLAMLLIAGATAALASRRGFRFGPVFLLVAAAYGSHLFADLLRPAREFHDGEQLLWPFPHAYAITVNILPHIHERADFPSTAAYLRAVGIIVLREALVLGPLAVLAHFVPPRIPARSAVRSERA